MTRSLMILFAVSCSVLAGGPDKPEKLSEDIEHAFQHIRESLTRDPLVFCGYFAAPDLSSSAGLSPEKLQALAPISRSYPVTEALAERLLNASSKGEFTRLDVAPNVHFGFAIVNLDGHVVLSLYMGGGGQDAGIVNSIPVSAGDAFWKWLRAEMRELESAYVEFEDRLTKGEMTGSEILSYRAASSLCPP